MNSITVKGNLAKINKVERTYKSTIANAINDSFTLIQNVQGDSAILSGIVNSNYKETGERYLNEFKKVCLQEFQEHELEYK